MERNDLDRLMARSRRAYEMGRLWRSLAIGLVAAIPGATFAVLTGALRPAVLAAVAYLVYSACLWRGRWLGQGAHAGLAWALVPLTLSLLAQPLGGCHVAGVCTSWCSLACSVGGLVIGFAVSGFARSAGSPGRYWAAGTAVALLAGSTACQCAGMGSLLGMAAAILVASAPLVGRLAVRR